MRDSVSSDRKRLLVLTSTFPRWKGDREPPFVYELSRRLVKDFDVWVLAPHAPGALLRENWDGLNVVRFRYFFEPLEVLAYQGGILANLRRNSLSYLLVPLLMGAQLIALVRLVARERIDAIHAHWLIPQGIVAVAGRWLCRRKPAVLCTAHGSDLHGLRGGLFSLAKRRVMERADAVTVVSAAMQEYAVGFGGEPDKISVLSMGVDATGLFVPDNKVARGGDELLYVGRLTGQKGVESLIRALPEIVRRRPGVVLTVVGTGPQEQELRALSRKHGLEHRVKFLGAIENSRLPELYRRASVLVLPSLGEGFGLVCAEALSCECPVVASDLPGVREIVQDEENGLLFPPGDSGKLAGQVLALLAAPALQRRFGQAGRALVIRRYDWQVVAKAYSALLKRVMKAGELRQGAGNAVEVEK